MPFQKILCQCLDKHLYHLLTWNAVDGSERPEHPDRPDGGEIELLHIEAVLERAGEGRQVGRGNCWWCLKRNALCQREAKLSKRGWGSGCQAKQGRKVQRGLKGSRGPCDSGLEAVQ